MAVGTLLYAHLPGNLPAQKPALVAIPSYVYDSGGNNIGVFRQFELTVPIQPTDIPQVLKDAVVAAEDKRFWEHKGVDARGVLRAAWTDYNEGETVQGGSTITQQYVKNAYLTGDRTLSRKLREAILATQLERRMSKEDILFNYLNTVYFGSGAYGVGAAAQSYFGKPVNQLTLSESAMLAGLIPAPTDYSPRVDSQEAEHRRQIVLDEMLEAEADLPGGARPGQGPRALVGGRRPRAGAGHARAAPADQGRQRSTRTSSTGWSRSCSPTTAPRSCTGVGCASRRPSIPGCSSTPSRPCRAACRRHQPSPRHGARDRGARHRPGAGHGRRGATTPPAR